MSGQKIGYIRVSALDQNPERQLHGMDLQKKFVEHSSGKDIDRPQLKALLDYAREGDTVFFHSMDRLARNLSDLRGLVDFFVGQKIEVVFVQESLRFAGNDSPMAKLLLSVMGAVAEFERALLRERQLEGIALAKKRGAYTGRKPSLTPEQKESLRARVAAGEKKSLLMKEFGISRGTLYRYCRP